MMTAGGMVVRALPLAIFLFFFFPRIQADFGLFDSLDSQTTASELNDSLVAGELALSAFNEQLAFRVEFSSDAKPVQQDLYWRAKTMPVEENFQWAVEKPRTSTRPVDEESSTNIGSTTWQYQILHEKSTDRYRPYLDYVVKPTNGKLYSDFTVYTRKPEPKAFSYKLSLIHI